MRFSRMSFRYGRFVLEGLREEDPICRDSAFFLGS